jgi:hypothetical protein
MDKIDLVTKKINEGKIDEAKLIFATEIFFKIFDSNYYEFLVSDFKLYIKKYSDLLFGSNEGYIQSYDFYDNTFDSSRTYIQALIDAKLNIEKGKYNAARTELKAIGSFLISNKMIYEDLVTSYYTMLFHLITDLRQNDKLNQDSEEALITFFKVIRKNQYEKFEQLVDIIFRDFKSVILNKLKAENDFLSVFDLEFNVQKKNADNSAIDIDKAIDDFNSQLLSLVGINRVKEEIQLLISFAKINRAKKEKGMKIPNVSKHLVFTGNPGTGKTTVARLLASIYYNLGLLSNGQCIEVERSQLVGEYVGHTAPKTKKIVESAKGGILFIDEAYSLVSGSQNDFGNEAIETLLKLMEDYRDDLIVIIAGYPDKMDTFIKSNPGLNSRF